MVFSYPTEHDDIANDRNDKDPTYLAYTDCIFTWSYHIAQDIKLTVTCNLVPI